MLLLLWGIEEKVEQAFGGSHVRGKRRGTRKQGRNDHHAAPHAPDTQLFTQRLTPRERNTTEEARPALHPGFTIVRGGKRAV